MLRTAVLIVAALLASACSSNVTKPVTTVPKIDLPRFMGDWYVIASIPTFMEKDAWNAVESYKLNQDGTIATTFTYNKGGFDGPQKRMTPKGFVKNTATNAEWRMQFFWLAKAEYLISYVNEDYTQTIIARSKRDYVWIMARTPSLPAADYDALVNRVHALGYKATDLRRVPQQPR